MTKVLDYNFDCDLSKVILWQYNDAEKLKTKNKTDWDDVKKKVGKKNAVELDSSMVS